MSEKPKRKHSPIRYIWHRARSHPIPFSYEVEGSLEHVVRTLRDLRRGLNYFVIEEKPLSSEYQDYEFTFKATDDEIRGHLLQTSETTCAIEGTITLNLRFLYASIVMVVLGMAAIFVAPNQFCGFPIFIIGTIGGHTFRLRDSDNSYDYILGLLETAVKTIEETPPLSQPLQKANHHPSPKHSRPTDPAAHGHEEEEKRKRS